MNVEIAAVLYNLDCGILGLQHALESVCAAWGCTRVGPGALGPGTGVSA